MISDTEKEKRREAVEFARASIELEGFKIPTETLAKSKLFVEGKLTLEEWIGAAAPPTQDAQS